jgi:hypothetical protein
MVLAPTYPNQNIIQSPGSPMENFPGFQNSNGIYRPQMAIPVSSWMDLSIAQPIDPKLIMLYGTLGATVGSFTRSTNALQGAWVASSLAFTGNNTKVVSLDTTDAATTVDAQQWTFNHQMVNAAANIPPALSKVAFLRYGTIWDCQIEINFGASNYNNVQLTLRDNLGTSGQFLNGATGSIPVISFGNGITGNQVLHVSLYRPGTYSMVLIMLTGANWSAFEMEWIVIA